MNAAPPSLRVVVVDDDPDHRFVVKRLFARAGVSDVHDAVDGADAVEVVTRVRPDLVVLDLAMPNRSGFDALPDLRALVPDAPIVVLSNLSRRRWEGPVVERGAVGFVEKRTPTKDLVGEILTAAALLEQIAMRLATRFDAAVGAPREARRFVRGALAEVEAELLDAVELLVTELVTNAVVHAASAPEVEMVLLPDRVRVEVRDADPTLPVRRTPDGDRPGGRGLLLLDRLASGWGAEPSDGGKVVWFEVDRAR